MKNKKTKKPILGIALDSGGAKGGAHIGVLDVLYEHNIPIDLIIGSSAGAFIGALYASGRIDEFKKIINDMTFRTSLRYYLDPIFPLAGLLAGKRTRGFLADLFGDIHIEDLPTRFVAIATDLLTGETVVIEKGPLVDAIMASISMPGIFKPVVYMKRILIDGGVANPLPLDVLKSYAPKITVACNLHPKLPDRYKPSQRRAILDIQKSEIQEEDIPSWIVDNVSEVIKTQSMLDGIKPLAKILIAKLSRKSSVKIRADLARLFQNQLSLSKDKIYGMLEKSFSKKDGLGFLNIFEVMALSTNIQQYQKNKLLLTYEKPDVLIEPDVTDIASIEFSRILETIQEGRKKAKAAIPEIKKLLKAKRR
jgi:NTE family protein